MTAVEKNRQEGPVERLKKKSNKTLQASAGSYFSACLPPDVAKVLDFSTIAPAEDYDFEDYDVDVELNEIGSDALYQVNSFEGELVFIYAVWEKVSEENPLLPFLVLKRMVSIWEEWLLKMPDAEGLPFIIPLVLTNGKPSSDAVDDIRSLMDIPEELAAVLEPHLLRFKLLRVDVSSFDPEFVWHVKA